MIIDDLHYGKLWESTRSYIDKNCIYRVPKGKTLLFGKKPGTFYSWQFYLRRGLFNHHFLSAVSEMFLYKAEKEFGCFDFQICGMETASTPLLAGIPLIARQHGIDINAFSVRKNRKEYGLLNWIEGVVNDKPILMIDDLCNSTESLAKTLEILLRCNYFNVLDRAFAVVNKVKKDEEKANNDKHLPEQMQMMYLFTLDNFDLTQPPGDVEDAKIKTN